MMKDPQKQRLYDWEDSWWGWNRNLCSLQKCRAVIRFACHLYGVSPPTVKQHNVRSISWSIPQARQISLRGVGPSGKGGLNLPTALHEATHQIVWDYYGDAVEDHGVEFVGVYVWLLNEAGIAPQRALVASLEHVDMRWDSLSPNEMPPKVAVLEGAADKRLLKR
jgi:hypothetical protein